MKEIREQLIVEIRDNLSKLTTSILFSSSRKRSGIEKVIFHFLITFSSYKSYFEAHLFFIDRKEYSFKDLINRTIEEELIEKGEEILWETMHKDRNIIAHEYKDQIGVEIYWRIKTYLPVFKKTFKKIENSYPLKE